MTASGIAVIGAGSWGTALAIALAGSFHTVRLWAHDPGLAHQMSEKRRNDEYLPGFTLPAAVAPTASLPDAVSNAGSVLLVIPSRYLRSVVQELAPHLSGDEILISSTKGIEQGTLARMSQVIEAETGSSRVAVLSGPTFAREIADGQPAAVVIASRDPALAAQIQGELSVRNLRLYTNTDVAGVEIGAALKNVIAIAAGIVQGLGLGSNTMAALVTRGLAEITRLAVSLGGKPSTLSGLAGLGDLLLTCTGDLSRNRRVGMELARGRTVPEVLASTNMIPEGVDTTAAALDLARSAGVELPITEQIQLILTGKRSPADGIRALMDRALKSE